MKKDKNKLVREFVKFNIQVLDLRNIPKMVLTTDRNKTQTYAHADLNKNEIVIYTKNRSLGDIFRSISHELIHLAQNEKGTIDTIPNPGSTGSPIENEANAGAGIMMRHFGKLHPEIFE
tara:strand:- start:85 stop:441 length:357 start_codon:yes stop_codon:yes gene_type:complete